MPGAQTQNISYLLCRRASARRALMSIPRKTGTLLLGTFRTPGSNVAYAKTNHSSKCRNVFINDEGLWLRQGMDIIRPAQGLAAGDGGEAPMKWEGEPRTSIVSIVPGASAPVHWITSGAAILKAAARFGTCRVEPRPPAATVVSHWWVAQTII